MKQTSRHNNYLEKKNIIDKKELSRIIKRISTEIIEQTNGLDDVIIIGLQTRGVFIAERIAKTIKTLENIIVPTGSLDISLYRDDLENIKKHIEIKETKFPIDIDNKNIILVDDVLFTGRSIRASIECLMDFGRPKSIKLAVLIDRGHRELPIQPDFIGKQFVTNKKELISVKLKEIDNEEKVVLLEKK